MGILLGHLLGDYVFQSDWMAINKKRKGIKGLCACLVHCLIWSFMVYLFGFCSKYGFLVFCLLFFSHFILDRWGFVVWYLNKFRIMPNPTLWKIVIVDNSFHLLMIYIVVLFFN